MAVSDSPGVKRGTVVVVGDISHTSPDRRPTSLTSLTSDLHVQWPAEPGDVATRADGRTAALDGAAIVGNQLVADPGSLLSVWGDLSIPDLARVWGDRARQSACAYLWDPQERALAMLPDPLGGATLFRLIAQDLQLVSTDYGALVTLARALGASPTKELMYQVERTVFGNGGLWHASHRDVTRVPTFHYLTTDGTHVRESRYASYRVLSEHTSYFDALQGIRTDVVESVEALRAAPSDDLLAHLTGGFDSRLVLGALLATGSAPDFAFFCSGPPESADRGVADGLARTFGLTRTTSAGMVPLVVGPPPEQQLALMRYTAGLSTVGPTGQESRVGTVAAGGGYGELFRSFYSTSLTGEGPDPWSNGRALATAMLGAPPDEGGILTPHALDLIGGRLSQALQSIADRGVPQDLVGDVFYSEVRNRYHMGATSLFWSRVGVRVNPLYSVHGLAGARELPGLARRSNVLGYDLLESFGHNLSRYPFDSDRSSPEYRRQRRPRTPVRFRDAPLSWAPTRARAATNGYVAPTVDAGRRAELIKRASALGVNQWQSDQLETTQTTLAAVIEQIDLSTYADVLNLDYLRELSRTATWSRTRVRHLYAASGMLMWYSDEE